MESDIVGSCGVYCNLRSLVLKLVDSPFVDGGERYCFVGATTFKHGQNETCSRDHVKHLWRSAEPPVHLWSLWHERTEHVLGIQRPKWHLFNLQMHFEQWMFHNEQVKQSETNPSQIPTVSMGAWKCTSPWKHICWWEKPRTKTAGQRSKWTWVGLKMRYLPVPTFPIRFWQFGGSFLHFLDIQMNVATLHATCCDSKRVSTKRNQLRIHWKKNWSFLESKKWIDMLLFTYPTTSHYMVGYCRLYDVICHSVSMKNLQYIPTLINQPSFISSIRYIYIVLYSSPKKGWKVMYLQSNGIWLFYLVGDYYTQYTVFSRSPWFFPAYQEAGIVRLSGETPIGGLSHESTYNGY